MLYFAFFFSEMGTAFGSVLVVSVLLDDSNVEEESRRVCVNKLAGRSMCLERHMEVRLARRWQIIDMMLAFLMN